MAIYLYRATNIYTQKQVKGELDAESKIKIYEKLVEQDLYPERIQKKTSLTIKHLFEPKVRLNDIAFLCKQLSAMLGAGIGIIETLEVCMNQCTHHTLKRHLENVIKSIQDGLTLEAALEKETIFPNFMIRLIECGEQTGHLSESIKQIEENLEAQIDIRHRVKRALTYPIIVLSLVAIVVIIMMLKVIPAYINLLEDMGGEMPLPTLILIKISTVLSHHWIVLSCLVIILILGCHMLYRVPKIRAYFERFYLSIPLLSQVIKKNLSAQFAMTLSMMIKSDIPILEALEMTKHMIRYSIAQKEISQAIRYLEEGSLLADAFSDSIIYPPILLSMIRIGEESHTLADILNQMGQYFKDEAFQEIQQLTLLIQPIMMIVIGLILGGIMAAILLPTFSAVTSVL